MLRSILLVALLGSFAFAQPRKPKLPVDPVVPEYEMGVIDLKAKDRKVMLMTFLERVSEELQRASLEKRSFIPEIVRTVDAEQL